MRTSIFLLILAVMIVPHSGLAATDSIYHQQQLVADRFYDAGDYKQAMKEYLPLAKKGDGFSQYRVSYMYLEGQGLEADLVESYAWAYLAAQNRHKELVKYRDTVGSLVPENQHRKALRRVDYYTRKWGNIALADDASRGARQQLRDCTGSRVGSRCEEVEAMQMPKFWAITPGNGSNAGAGGDGGGAAPSGSGSSSQGHGTGGATKDVAYYQQLRSSIRQLNSYIGQNAGNVELGEFEVLEEQPPESDTENDGR